MSLSTSEDVVQSKGRFLWTQRGGRFFLKGVAFPDAPPERTDDEIPNVQYDPEGWIAILEQLRAALPVSALNTIRLYQLDADTDYSEFFQAAARLEFYLLVPLTGRAAVLNRLALPPKCYPPELWDYGRRMVESALQHANVLAGVLGNEVMNDLESWQAAPCLQAYARDLKGYQQWLQQQPHLQKFYNNRINPNGTLLPLPLLYAAQDSGIGAALTDVDTIRLSVDYLTCSSEGAIDIFGVNAESWCATKDTFRTNDDGTIGTLYQLWQGLHANVHVPLVFSELGCSHSRYNKDTPELRTAEGTRDWYEVPAVLEDMRDTWSGYSAYAYWGNSLFNMMAGGPWNGRDLLEPTQDFEHFQQQSLLATSSSRVGEQQQQQATSTTGNAAPVQAGSLHDLPLMNGGIMEQYYRMLQNSNQPPTCAQVQEVLLKAANLQLEALEDLPSYFDEEFQSSLASSRQTVSFPILLKDLMANGDSLGRAWTWGGTAAGLATGLILVKRYHSRRRRRDMYEHVPDHGGNQ